MKSLPGILLGLAAGVALGIVLAPQSGKKTRKRVANETDSFFKNLQTQLQEGLENIKHQYNDYTNTAATRAKDAVEDVKRRVN